ncbi:uncharacterized protein BX664DRAFT_328499 [Halteromyces radiatus]|uniref:uncharacterized protein n=1 Tax=Halteromyces radiatus TaxID=101107 RepID=UPI00221EF41B|nr:uncharacterized protein BX664DRAFT_328499 [Halteromyces radiatus]KAI8092916.1 hypothetical protein BX664DRAFT_328499 [Halteromyces radiatus]
MDLNAWLRDTLQQRLEKQDQWTYLCQGMLQEDIVENEVRVDKPSILFLQNEVKALIEEKGIFAAGAIPRPYYRAMAYTLDSCYKHGGRLPPLLLDNPLNMLTCNNSDRLEQIQIRLSQIVSSNKDSSSVLQEFLFEYLEPEDWRLWLLMRTTTGSKGWRVMPPSLNQCLTGFSTLYQKQYSLNDTTDTNNKKKKNMQNHILTVGAKALSKHWHRDRQNEFWGNCTGSESTKNDHANRVLLKILTNAVWINLHSLPHDQAVYEIRESNGYGARWTTTTTKEGKIQDDWLFRGFLEPQMEDGHSLGWIH